MKIELKKISFSERMSEETNAFTADLHIDGKNVGYCKNTGQGGCTDYHWNTIEDRKTIEAAEAYCKALPKVQMFGKEFDQNLEDVIDQLLEDYLKAKEVKKIEKHMSTSILFGIPNDCTYQRISYKKPLSTFDKQQLVDALNRIYLKYCTNGVVILNTNLDTLGIEFCKSKMYALKA